MDVSAAEIAAVVERALRHRRGITGLWSISDIAEWAGISERKARELVATPGFPRAGRLPNDGPALGHPRWVAVEVVEWWDQRRGE
jgi:hypothetical protein